MSSCRICFLLLRWARCQSWRDSIVQFVFNLSRSERGRVDPWKSSWCRCYGGSGLADTVVLTHAIRLRARDNFWRTWCEIEFAPFERWIFRRRERRDGGMSPLGSIATTNSSNSSRIPDVIDACYYFHDGALQFCQRVGCGRFKRLQAGREPLNYKNERLKCIDRGLEGRLLSRECLELLGTIVHNELEDGNKILRTSCIRSTFVDMALCSAARACNVVCCAGSRTTSRTRPCIRFTARMPVLTCHLEERSCHLHMLVTSPTTRSPTPSSKFPACLTSALASPTPKTSSSTRDENFCRLISVELRRTRREVAFLSWTGGIDTPVVDASVGGRGVLDVSLREWSGSM
jgi:hypothetical protein